VIDPPGAGLTLAAYEDKVQTRARSHMNHVLIVKDPEASRCLLKALLEGSGYCMTQEQLDFLQAQGQT